MNTLQSSKLNSPNNQKELVLLLKKSITPEIIKLNINNLREGIFDYLLGKKSSLPDLYLTLDPKVLNNSNIQYDSLKNLNKINLDTLLSFINREDILNCILYLRLLCYCLSILPNTVLLFYMILFFLYVVLSKKSNEIFKWVQTSLITCCILCSTTIIGVYIYENLYLSSDIYPITMSIPLEKDVTLKYLQSLLKHMLNILAIQTVIIIMIIIGLSLSLKALLLHFSKIANKNINIVQKLTKS